MMEQEIIKKLKNSANTPLGNSTTLLLGWKVRKDEATFAIDNKSLYNDILRIYWIFLLGVIILSSNNYHFLVLILLVSKLMTSCPHTQRERSFGFEMNF